MLFIVLFLAVEFLAREDTVSARASQLTFPIVPGLSDSGSTLLAKVCQQESWWAHPVPEVF
jgi:hypothetical protein